MNIKTYMALAVAALTAACSSQDPAEVAEATATASQNEVAAEATLEGGAAETAENVKEK